MMEKGGFWVVFGVENTCYAISNSSTIFLFVLICDVSVVVWG
jgi:hypothetical protein